MDNSLNDFYGMKDDVELTVPESMITFILTGGKPNEPFEIMVHQIAILCIKHLRNNDMIPDYQNTKTLMGMVINIID